MKKGLYKEITKGSILTKLWKYFIVFAGIIFLMLWLLQIVFLNYFYESMKLKDVAKIGTNVQEKFKDEGFKELVENYSLRKSLTIKVVDEYGNYVYPISNAFEESIRPPISKVEFDKLFSKIQRENLKYNIWAQKVQKMNNSVLTFAGYLGNADGVRYYISIQSILEPVDFAIDILRKQLLIVSLLSLIISMILSYFISKRLARPIERLSETARDMAGGNLDVKFVGKSYDEINNLSRALNLATEEVNKTLELRKDLIANVSHDLKTPLTLIKSYGEMIKDISGDNKEMREKHINVIIDEADHLTDLVNNLLDISKLESKLEDFNPFEFDLKEIIEGEVKRFKSLEKDFQIKTTYKGDLKIKGDPQRIKQVVYNLISNAIKYSGKSKKIEIKAEEISKDTVRFDCIDFGIGISQEEIENIWERFYRAGDNRTRPRVGTGLGLFIVKSILDIHSYAYGVKSTLGKGSDFYFIANK